MGAKLVSLAFVFAAHKKLKPNEKLLLIFMAHTALDGDAVPRYFASREHSAYALGRMVPEQPDPLDAAFRDKTDARASAFQAVKVATRGLVDAGAIRQLRRGREGVRAEYALAMGDALGIESLPLAGSKSVLRSAVNNLPQPVGTTYLQGGTHDYQEPRPGRTRLPAAHHFPSSTRGLERSA